MGIPPVICDSVAVRVEYPGHLQSLLDPAESLAQVHRRSVARPGCGSAGAGTGAGEWGRFALRSVFLSLRVHARPDVNEGPESVQREQAEPAGHVDRLRLGVMPLMGDLVWEVVNVNERVERERQSDDQDHQ